MQLTKEAHYARAGLTIVPVVPWEPPRRQVAPINRQFFTTLF